MNDGMTANRQWMIAALGSRPVYFLESKSAAPAVQTLLERLYSAATDDYMDAIVVDR